MADGTEVPYYIIPFDKKGRCEGPRTRQHLLDHAGQYTDIYLFSHGWNNDWQAATGRYENFIEGFIRMRQSAGLPMPAGYRPLLVGVFWPSTGLVKDSERGPRIAAASPEQMDEAVADERQSVREIADALPDEAVDRFYALIQQEKLSEEEALELARLSEPLYHSAGDELPDDAGRSPDDLVAAWKLLAASAPYAAVAKADLSTIGKADDEEEEGAPQAAGRVGDFFKSILPRDALRTFTVWQMKDRAGMVGARGVAPLLTDLLRDSEARVHLLGHSFGGKVVLSALCAPSDLPRKAHAALLLQPAVSHLCFAERVPGTDRPGGYRAALQRVERPILSTFSANDFPLTKIFHLALWRGDDLGEARIAGAGPPSQYAALGGYGPRGAGEQIIDILDVNQSYQLDPAVKVYGVRGDRTISGHGDVSNESTWWALYNLVKK
jgi:hypothetical protein